MTTHRLWATCTNSLDLHTHLRKQVLNKCSYWSPYSAGKDFLSSADWDLFLIAWLQDVDMEKKEVLFLYPIKLRPDSSQVVSGRLDPCKCWRIPKCSEDFILKLKHLSFHVSGLHILNCCPPSHIFSPALCSSN